MLLTLQLLQNHLRPKELFIGYYSNINIAQAIKMVHANAVFIREEAKLARDTHSIYFQCEAPLPALS